MLPSLLPRDDLEEATDSLFEFDPRLAEEATRREYEADTIFWITVRLLGIAQRDRKAAEKMEVGSPLQVLCFRIVAQFLEAISDWTNKIARISLELEKQKNVLGKPLMDRIRQITTYPTVYATRLSPAYFPRTSPSQTTP